MKNWKTTLAGVITGTGIVVLDLFEKGVTDPKTVIVAAGLAFFGYLSKDFDTKQ